MISPSNSLVVLPASLRLPGTSNWSAKVTVQKLSCLPPSFNGWPIIRVRVRFIPRKEKFVKIHILRKQSFQFMNFDLVFFGKLADAMPRASKRKSNQKVSSVCPYVMICTRFIIFWVIERLHNVLTKSSFCPPGLHKFCNFRFFVQGLFIIIMNIQCAAVAFKICNMLVPYVVVCELFGSTSSSSSRRFFITNNNGVISISRANKERHFYF